jgi:hypothetical protein
MMAGEALRDSMIVTFIAYACQPAAARLSEASLLVYDREEVMSDE